LILSSNPDNAHILGRDNPISNCDTNSKKVLQKSVASSPVPRNLVSLNSSAQFASRFAQNFNLRQSRPAFPMSSPLRGSASVPSTNFKDIRFSSPIAPRPRSAIPSPNPNQYRRTLFKPCFPPAGIEPRVSRSSFLHSFHPIDDVILAVRLVSNLPTRPTIKPEEMPEHLPQSDAYHRIKAGRGRFSFLPISFRLIVILSSIHLSSSRIFERTRR